MDPQPPEATAAVVSTPHLPPSAHSGPDAQALNAGGDSVTMSQDAEVDLKEVELNELEPEKQPMNAASGTATAVQGGGEKNGLVKIKVAEDDAEAAAKFTGLSKEELLKVAGSPGWVRTRWALLVLFWVGWLGMLAGAVVIIVRAPRCRELPAQHWWHKGALYRVDNLQAFEAAQTGSLAGLKEYLDHLSSLKVKGLVLGPIHKNQKDDLAGTNLKQIDPALGSQEDFNSLLQSAKKKGIHIILDLTPNYRSQNSWFLPAEVDTVALKVKEALKFWLEEGVDGFQVLSVGNLMDASSYLTEWHNITKSFSEDKLLIAGTESSDLQQIMSLLDTTKDHLLLTSSYLSQPNGTVMDTKFLVTQFLNATDNHWCSWSLSQEGLMTTFIPAQLLRLYQLLFFTLPGTPVFSYGDEIGLQAAPGQPFKAPIMPWNESSLPDNTGFITANMTVKGQNEDPGSLLSLFRKLSDQRGKEHSLLHGDFHVISSGSGLFSYVRHWDQNERFLVVLNFGSVGLPAKLRTYNLPASTSLPATAHLLLSTQPNREAGISLELGNLNLAPHEGLLLHFPYVA
ncbi:4F2 cell-surface antigen heavy chain [Perognathus longimembris pacificus]|uniref:4F2 cell-surface antigen heavy chain n=1 Tax=Perognathus longimembris pacificus TaxID=214514 RepID=UPI0020186578|nr:4F2 cell-surface antigen heavy chain [Perognathus longimembris pacificus]